ncbi:CRISPR-associated endoribonuclease Cas6 [Fervidobacterium islandicum]|uniref:CRISPR-associated endoribonuclease Cas6 n=1 Tax=Fervidobacterium islandicum TaxID=2423 RepID=UPI003A6CF75B
MFYSPILILKSLDDGTINHYAGKKIHGWFFKVLKQADEVVSSILHSNISDKSFTVSSFLGHNVSKPIQIEKGKNYTIRITLLEDRIFELFTNQVFEEKLKNAPVQIENVEFTVEGYTLDQTHKWSGFISEEELFKIDHSERIIKMKFYTPTCFRIGDLHLREPDPEKVFTSILRKFNKYSSIKIDESIAERFKEIKIKEQDTIQKRVYFPNFYIQGFVGTVVFEVPDDEKLLLAAHVLSEFAFYSGVGYKSTMGLGQAKREKPEISQGSDVKYETV